MLDKISWWCKSRRAQTVDDFETWVEGASVPTLNSFDNGDTRATVLIIFSHTQGLDAQPSETVSPTLRKGGAGMAIMDDDPIVFYGNRVDDIRVQGEVVNTLQARMGTGGGNMPLAYFPIQDGRDIEKFQNGLGVGNENDPAYTLDRTGAQAIAIQGNVIGRSDTAGPQGKGYTEEGDPMFTLTKTDTHAVAYDEFNDSISDIHHTLRAGTKQSTGVVNSIVRRLTPIECERLQGFPDNWTDGQTDGHRYKQMGNALTVNVAEWIVSNLVKLDNGDI